MQRLVHSLSQKVMMTMPDPDHYPDPIPEGATEVAVCPRCDRKYYAETPEKALELVKAHVILQHPDHDPEWAA